MMNNNHSLPPPRSRRERPAKPALTRQGIIDVALTILRDEGLHKVTMRRIAEALDTGPASLYVYVHNTTDLHVQLLDALLATIPESLPAEGTWRDRVKLVLERYSSILFAYPEIARMALVMHPSGPHYLALVEQLLALLHEGDMPDREAAWVVDLLLLQATASAAEHSTRRASTRASTEDSTLVATIAAIDPRIYPSLARIGSELFSGSGQDRFFWSIDVLLSGAFAAPRPVPAQEQTSTHQEPSSGNKESFS